MDDIKLDFSRLRKNHPSKPIKDLPVLNEIPQDVELSRVMASQNDLKKLYAAALENKVELGRNASVLHAEIHKEDKKVFDEIGGNLVKLDESVDERVAVLDEKTRKEVAAIIKVVREEVDFKVNFIHTELNRTSAILHDINAKISAINNFEDVSGVALVTQEIIKNLEKLSAKLDKEIAGITTANSKALAAFKDIVDDRFSATAADVAKLRIDQANAATSLSNFSSDVARVFGELDERTKKSLAEHRSFLTALNDEVAQLKVEIDELKNR